MGSEMCIRDSHKPVDRLPKLTVEKRGSAVLIDWRVPEAARGFLRQHEDPQIDEVQIPEQEVSDVTGVPDRPVS